MAQRTTYAAESCKKAFTRGLFFRIRGFEQGAVDDTVYYLIAVACSCDMKSGLIISILHSRICSLCKKLSYGGQLLAFDSAQQLEVKCPRFNPFYEGEAVLLSWVCLIIACIFPGTVWVAIIVIMAKVVVFILIPIKKILIYTILKTHAQMRALEPKAVC